jgi:ADP-heptose:LPS heptosyltransferase
MIRTTVNRILVLSLSGIGDTLMATPLFHELQTQFPKARVEALVLWKGARQVLVGNPHLNEVFQHDFLKSFPLSSLWCCWKLRRRRYDLSINTHTQGRRGYRMISRLIGANVRLSHEYENQCWLDRLLVTHSLPQDYKVHAMENNARLLGLIRREQRMPRHGYEVFLSDAEVEWARDWIAGHRLTGKRILGIHVGSGGTKNLALRRWPVARYGELLRELAARNPDLPVVLFGGPEERTAHAELHAAGVRFIEADTPGLREAIALVRECHAFLSVDTLFMHIAAAMGVPHQFVIETPTLNPPVYPRRDDWTLIPNPSIGGRHLEFYRYDGRDIAGKPARIRAMMESVTVAAVLEKLAKAGL